MEMHGNNMRPGIGRTRQCELGGEVRDLWEKLELFNVSPCFQKMCEGLEDRKAHQDWLHQDV